MGKRAQQKRAAKQAKRSRGAASPRPVTFAAAAAVQLPQLLSMGDDEPLETPWGTFIDSFPTVADAVTAAEEAGGLVSCFSFDDSGEYERGLRRGEDGWLYEVTLYPRGSLRDLVKTSWLNAEDQDQAVEQLRHALADCVPAELRCPGLAVLARTSTTAVPRIGWVQSFPVSGRETWEDVRLTEKGLPLFDLAPLADGSGDFCEPLPDETFALFRARGLTARACAGCGAAVTDRHPHWPGVWVSVENEFGPVCEQSRIAGQADAVQQIGHVVDSAVARPVGMLTGKEQKVQCRHCDAHVTEQHPDWPGVWAKAGGNGTPVCAVVGSGCDDARSYDLVDCVYPHVPVGEDSPAASAISVARQVGYFFQPRAFSPLSLF